MMLKKTAVALALGLGLVAGANATTTTITNLGPIAVPSSVSLSGTPTGSFLDAYNFIISGATYSAGAVTSIELPNVTGIEGLQVQLWEGIYGDSNADTLKNTLVSVGPFTKYGFGTYSAGNYFYTIEGIGNGGVIGSIGKGHYVAGVDVSPVPEPETYAMLLTGLGLMATIARRRNKAKAS